MDKDDTTFKIEAQKLLCKCMEELAITDERRKKGLITLIEWHEINNTLYQSCSTAIGKLYISVYS